MPTATIETERLLLRLMGSYDLEEWRERSHELLTIVEAGSGAFLGSGNPVVVQQLGRNA